jgi:hypothetical protein
MFVWKIRENGSRLRGRFAAAHGGETIEDI